MPAAYVKSLAKETGKSVAEVEKRWNKAKEIAKDEYPDVKEESDRFYAIVTGIFKKIEGVDSKAKKESFESRINGILG